MDSAQNNSGSRARFILKRVLFVLGVAVSAAMIIVPISEMNSDSTPSGVSVIELQVSPLDMKDTVLEEKQDEKASIEKMTAGGLKPLGEVRTAAVATDR